MAQDVKKSPYKDLSTRTTMIDSFRGYVQEKLVQITYPATGESIVFNSGIVDDFSDNFNANWTAEQSYGRMDSIANYSNTTRSMSVRLILIAEASEIAVRNMSQMGKMAQFLYPTYEGGVLKDRPLLQVKMMNLIQDAQTNGPLLGYITSLNHTFDLKEGVFEVVGQGDEEGQLFLYPKYLTINFDFNPLHSQRLGFSSDNSDGSDFTAFPYAVKNVSAQIGDNPDDDLQTTRPVFRTPSEVSAARLSGPQQELDAVTEAAMKKILDKQRDDRMEYGN
jgi:hypothetical protein